MFGFPSPYVKTLIQKLRKGGRKRALKLKIKILNMFSHGQHKEQNEEEFLQTEF